MGQGQSAAEDPSSEQPQKTDYYELLGIDRQASDEEIKKAYRRKALELHPDRNYGQVDEATRQFAEVQSAYEVLSDPQERAWYDSHRDILLRGDQGPTGASQEYSYNVRMTTAQEVSKLVLKFNGRLDYSDAPSGFYGGLNEFFQNLAKEEQIASQWEDEEARDYPLFGHKEDDYEDVVRPFYAAWNGFATKKSYSWKDEYRLSDAPDRRIRRLMEKENKRIRESAIQEFNDAVRSLVAFVRKRDPRYQDNQKSEAERQKILRDAAAAQAQRSRAARQAKLAELDQMALPQWAQSRTKDEHEGGFSSESDEEEHQYKCVVCDKVFKSEAQLDAHERSKKHLKLVKELKVEMQHDDEHMNGATTEGDIPLETEDHVDEEDEHMNADTIGKEASADIEAQTGKDNEGGLDEETDNDGPYRNGVVENSSANPQSEEPDDNSKDSDEDDDDYAPRSEVQERLKADPPSDLASRLAASTLDSTPLASDTESTSTNQPKVGKAKLKRAKKAATSQKTSTTNGVSGQGDDEFRCAMCQAGFPSKTKLFDHIKSKGHAAPISQMKGGGTKGGKGKKR